MCINAALTKIEAKAPHLELRSFPKREPLEEREMEKIDAKIEFYN